MDRRRRPDDHPEESESKLIGIRVPAHMNDQLEALAKRENNGVSAVIRRLLTQALREHGPAS
jgi:predicted DNA-binding protein